ncbi:hypothetical protein NDU88_007431 [Pleurodeles waltl]|uniref:Uncharacterized protein n=1 Tax=Pleurodeles waltl TaxID=8319 RepID=A0AAV7QKP5_PLEWA|nr:hypothetical protein NDU88_007431 [Pleurodeles waltl]
MCAFPGRTKEDDGTEEGVGGETDEEKESGRNAEDGQERGGFAVADCKPEDLSQESEFGIRGAEGAQCKLRPSLRENVATSVLSKLPPLLVMWKCAINRVAVDSEKTDAAAVHVIDIAVAIVSDVTLTSSTRFSLTIFLMLTVSLPSSTQSMVLRTVL